MPQQYGAVFGSRRDVAVGGDVALRATHARHHAVVTEDYLYYFGWKINYMGVRKGIKTQSKGMLDMIHSKFFILPVSVLKTLKLLSQNPAAMRNRESTVVTKQLLRARTRWEKLSPN